MKRKSFVLKFTFDKHGGKISSIDQLAIESYYDHVSHNIKRVHLVINDEEQTISSLGKMHIYQSRKSIAICWKFKKKVELGVTNSYHYKSQIPMVAEIKFKRLLDCWRTNTLF
eukprot:540957_1